MIRTLALVSAFSACSAPKPPAARTTPPAPKPTKAPDVTQGSQKAECNVLFAAGRETPRDGEHAEALELFEAALACDPLPYFEQVAFMAACSSANEPKAKLHFGNLTPDLQARMAVVCARQNPPVANE